uniref:F-box domain-containing protein n=1 Tax=Aegilops tauschii subsp. strangulata TaxID=200361 RepID=A0A453NG05_AEGTS
MQRKVRVAASSDGVLPEDMLRHILVRLPAKALCLFRSVSRSWRSLLSDPLFVAAHKSRHPGPLIVTCTSDLFQRGGTIEILDLAGHVVKRIAPIMKDARLERTRHLDLICVSRNEHRPTRHVINPATGDTFALPGRRAKEHAHVEHFFPVSFDFGQVGSTGEYKAIRCVSIDYSDSESSPMLCEVITLNDGRHARWRGKQGPPAPVTSYGNKSVVINGVVYFLVDFLKLNKLIKFSGDHVKPGSMVLFNLETEEWMGIVQGPLPVRTGSCSYFSLHMELSLLCLDGFLVMAHNCEDCSLDLWFLMDTEKSLWNKRYSIDDQNGNLFVQPLEILSDGRMVLSAPGLLRLYDPIAETYIDFEMRNSTFVGTYTGSLLSSESTFTSEAERCTICGCYGTLEAIEPYALCEDCMSHQALLLLQRLEGCAELGTLSRITNCQ